MTDFYTVWLPSMGRLSDNAHLEGMLQFLKINVFSKFSWSMYFYETKIIDGLGPWN